MESTGYRRPQFDPDSVAVGYDRDGNIWGRPTEETWDSEGPSWHLKGNGGLRSTAEDLACWNKALLGERILTLDARMKYYHPVLEATENHDSYYAYGWDVHRTPRQTILIWPNGTNGIFYADFVCYLDDGVTIIVLMNQLHPNFREVLAELARMIFDSTYAPPVPIADDTANRTLTASLVHWPPTREQTAPWRRARGGCTVPIWSSSGSMSAAMSSWRKSSTLR